jgi:hypothetical protein
MHAAGQAQASFTGVRVLPGSARMDGQAQVAFSRIAVHVGPAVMNGYAQVHVTGRAVTAASARMDGHASVIITWPLGAAVAQMDGHGSMNAVNSKAGPQTYPFTMTENIASGDRVTKISHHMSALLHHIINLYQPMLASGKYKRAYQDHLQLSDKRVLRFVEKLREVIPLTAVQAAHTSYFYDLVVPIRIQPILNEAAYAVINLIQNISMHAATIQKFIWGWTLAESFNLSDTTSVKGIYKQVLAQLFKLSDVGGLSHTVPIVLSQSIHLSLSLAGGISLKLLQNLLVATASSPVFRYHLTLAGRVVAGEILGHFTRAILAQLFTVHPVVSRQFVANNSLAQLLTVHPALTNKLILQIVGNLQLSPSQLVHMLYKGDPLLDGVVITALYISPSGTTTTWAVNTRTNAVTEYLNYAFRSFALMGNRYIAAGADGLYELEGDTDDGAAIISELMSGYLQLNEKKLFGIKGAYVAIRGGGRFYLKLISGDGREYVYELRAQPNLMTTKVKIGKGINTTYVAFDLVTEGQDFDLDSIEFIPMTRGRRV